MIVQQDWYVVVDQRGNMMSDILYSKSGAKSAATHWNNAKYYYTKNRKFRAVKVLVTEDNNE